jgi:hypothetical protein
MSWLAKWQLHFQESLLGEVSQLLWGWHNYWRRPPPRSYVRDFVVFIFYALLLPSGPISCFLACSTTLSISKLYIFQWQDAWWMLNWRAFWKTWSWHNRNTILEFSWRDRKVTETLSKDCRCHGREFCMVIAAPAAYSYQMKYFMDVNDQGLCL